MEITQSVAADRGSQSREGTQQLLDSLRDIASLFRPPAPRRGLPVPAVVDLPAVVSLASGRSPAESVDNLIALSPTLDAATVLVIPSVASRPGQGAHPHVVAALLLLLGPRATLAMPHGTSAPVRRRWERLARDRDASTIRLGETGWDAVVLDDDAYMLDRVLLPAEIHEFDHCIAVPALGDDTLALGFLREVVHPHTRLRARGNPARERLDVEVARAATMTYLLDASRLPGALSTHLACWAPDALSAELVGQSIRRYLESARGFETIGSWEHKRVQAATEIGFGLQNGDDLVLQVQESDARLRDLVTFIARDLTCQVVWRIGESRDG